jgi:hypothetical protein
MWPLLGMLCTAVLAWAQGPVLGWHPRGTQHSSQTNLTHTPASRMAVTEQLHTPGLRWKPPPQALCAGYK